MAKSIRLQLTSRILPLIFFYYFRQQPQSQLLGSRYRQSISQIGLLKRSGKARLDFQKGLGEQVLVYSSGAVDPRYQVIGEGLLALEKRGQRRRILTGSYNGRLYRQRSPQALTRTPLSLLVSIGKTTLRAKWVLAPMPSVALPIPLRNQDIQLTISR